LYLASEVENTGKIWGTSFGAGLDFPVILIGFISVETMWQHHFFLCEKGQYGETCEIYGEF
jgi:hypothetical protein